MYGIFTCAGFWVYYVGKSSSTMGCILGKVLPLFESAMKSQVLHLLQGQMCETSVLHRTIGFAAAVRHTAFGFRRFEGDQPRMGPPCDGHAKQQEIL